MNTFEHYNRHNGTRTIRLEWIIKGYHIFHRGPDPAIKLSVEIEENNRYDSSAMKVMVPNLNEIPQYLHENVTRQENINRRLPVQRVRDIAGQQIGRVPANLCRAFRMLLRNNFVQEISCFYKGEIRQSLHPHVQQRYRRNPTGGHDQAGGGADLFHKLNWTPDYLHKNMRNFI
ncbi:uncharacterized protein LOC117343104 [Pecten maximus]|uniref:uncharacterized protein LOC117343104 n=1 Tax=Pecten maximus TaxID=6579 RepID=UPI0014582395|nr:uncharacterized protein LOC117343104 [Pecten maximus]